jgi:predicted RNA binding protein YcfA (HicA-like mRNA interferase family)
MAGCTRERLVVIASTIDGIVVIAGHTNADVPKGTLSSILKQAGIKQP